MSSSTDTSGDQLSLPQLNDKIKELTALVHRQSKLIGQTGQQLIEIQVNDVKKQMGKAGSISSQLGQKHLQHQPQQQLNIDTSDFVTNEDIIQLVGELQGQLDNVEERSIRRTFNAQLNESTKDRIIAPISNKDGDYAPDDLFPTTISRLLSLDKFEIIQLSEFYELVIPLSQQQELQNFLASENVDSKEAEKLFVGGGGDVNDKSDLESRVNSYTQKQLDDLFDELSRYIGVNVRKNKNAW